MGSQGREGEPERVGRGQPSPWEPGKPERSETASVRCALPGPGRTRAVAPTPWSGAPAPAVSLPGCALGPGHPEPEVGGEVAEKEGTDSESPCRGDAEAERMEEQCRLQKQSLS